jgi:hypothetical protein
MLQLLAHWSKTHHFLSRRPTMLILQQQEVRLETHPNMQINRCQPEPSAILGQIEEIHESMVPPQ